METAPAGEGWHTDPAIGLGATMGRYELVSLVGTGGMGVVFAARDPELDRTVAVKILRSTSGVSDAGEARLRREGQTMARLTHPNVIRVYDVGVAHGHAWVAMEFVAGGTLASWLERESRTTDEILGAFVQAGRGLAAAHDAGLVHRDFKPANVLVGDDGRVLVTDFGLARAVDATGEAADAEVKQSTTDQVAGTPAYMAPEQLRGAAVDARADQFAFCVALWRGLFGAGPYRGDSVDELHRSIEGGELAPPPAAAAARVPKAVRAALERGLANEPAARFASMHELLAQIAPAPRVRRGLWLAAGLAVVAIAIVVVVLARRAAAADPCPPPERDIAAVWSDARRDALRAKLAAIDPVQSEARLAAALRTVEPFVAAWRTLHVDTCRATRVRGAQSDTLFDLRIRCLGRRLSELDTSLALLATAADRVQLDKTLGGLAKLTPLDGCADPARVARELALPTGPHRADAERLAATVQRLVVERRAGRLVGLPEATSKVVAEARTIDHPPTLAAALAALAETQLDLDDSAKAEVTLRELTEVAAAAHDDTTEAYAWRSLIVATTMLDKPDQATALLPAARAALVRAGSPLELRVELLYAEAGILDVTPKIAEGIAKLDEARALLEKAGARRPGSPLAPRLDAVLSERARAQHHAGDAEGALASFKAAAELERSIYGPDSVDEAISLNNQGEAARRAAKYDVALAALREAVRINEARAGAGSPRVANNHVSMGSVYLEQHEWTRALAAFDTALAMFGRLGDEQQKIGVLGARATALGHLGRYDEAVATYEEELGLIEKAGVTTTSLPIGYYNRAELSRRAKHCDRALPDYRRSTELFVEMRGPTTPYLLFPLVGEGLCLVETRQPAAAIQPLERALALEASGNQIGQVAYATIWLGRALVESGRDRARGLATARRGRDILYKAAKDDPDEQPVLAELDRWLAAHGG